MDVTSEFIVCHNMYISGMPTFIENRYSSVAYHPFKSRVSSYKPILAFRLETCVTYLSNIIFPLPHWTSMQHFNVKRIEDMYPLSPMSNEVEG